MLSAVRQWFRRQWGWIAVREATKEGLRHAWRRVRTQRRILGSPPMSTGTDSGPVEVRVLTWRRDWINMIWALKSFYHFAQVDYPLIIHDGGLTASNTSRLRAHFPNAEIVPAERADAVVGEALKARGLRRCLEYRAKNPSTRKLFDFYVLSDAEYVISIDSDIVFFRRPEALIVPPEGLSHNRYNRDSKFWYSMTPPEMEEAFGIRPPERINSGLNVIRRSSIDFAMIEEWLAHPKLMDDTWVTEQTLHALVSTLHGVEFLPPAYLVSTEAGLNPDAVCKHYPGYFRPLLYEEGMAHLIAAGFLGELLRR